MGKARASIVGVVLGSALTLCAARAEASGIEGCFRASHSFAMCNGFVASLAGLGGMAAPIVALTDPEEPSGASIALGVALGIYSGASGAALIASSQAQDPTSATRSSGTILGTVGVIAGGGALILSGVTGLVIGLAHRPKQDDGAEDDDVGRGLHLDSMAVGVDGVAGPALGLTLGGRF